MFTDLVFCFGPTLQRCGVQCNLYFGCLFLRCGYKQRKLYSFRPYIQCSLRINVLISRHLFLSFYPFWYIPFFFPLSCVYSRLHTVQLTPNAWCPREWNRIRLRPKMCFSWKEIFLDCRSHIVDVIPAQRERQNQNSYRSVLIFLDCIFNIKQQQTAHEQQQKNYHKNPINTECIQRKHKFSHYCYSSVCANITITARLPNSVVILCVMFVGEKNPPVVPASHCLFIDTLNTDTQTIIVITR